MHAREQSQAPDESTPAARIQNMMTKGFFLNSAINAVVYPLNTFKTRVQAHHVDVKSWRDLKTVLLPDLPQQNTASIFRNIYKGSMAGMLASALSRTAVYAGQPIAAEQLQPHMENEALAQAAAGGVVSAVDAAVMHPVYNLKGRRQLYPGDGRNWIKFIKEHGIPTCYNGLAAGVLEAAFGVAAIFGVNSVAMKAMGVEDQKKASAAQQFAGSVAGSTIALVVGNPFEVIENRAIKEMRPVSSFAIAKRIYQANGLRGFTRGLGANLVSTMPRKALTFFLFNRLITNAMRPETETSENTLTSRKN